MVQVFSVVLFSVSIWISVRRSNPILGSAPIVRVFVSDSANTSWRTLWMGFWEIKYLASNNPDILQIIDELPMGIKQLHHIWDFLYYRRSLAAQQRARQKEVLAQTKSMQNSISVGRRALQVP